MTRSTLRQKRSGKNRPKATVVPMSDNRRLEVAAQFTDDVLSKLAHAFFQVIKREGWGKRDLSLISGINETAIGHILAGRRKNLTVETIALLTRAMQTRPELILHDLRPRGNNVARLLTSAAAALEERQIQQPSAAARNVAGASYREQSGSLRELEAVTL